MKICTNESFNGRMMYKLINIGMKWFKISRNSLIVII